MLGLAFAVLNVSISLNFIQNPADHSVVDSAFGQLIDQSNIRWKHKRDMGAGDGGILQLVHCMLIS